MILHYIGLTDYNASRENTFFKQRFEEIYSVLLSLFCGAGGLDLGFERTGFEIGLALDIRTDAVASYNLNRGNRTTARCRDVCAISLAALDDEFGIEFLPEGVIGGPPCQSFSRANARFREDDPRHELPFIYAALLSDLNQRRRLKFFVFENVPGLCTDERHADRFDLLMAALSNAGFNVAYAVLNAADYGTAQDRRRLFIVGLNSELFPGRFWSAPPRIGARSKHNSVRSVIAGLPEPTFFRRDLAIGDIGFHPNHWCMVPRSKKFSTNGALVPGVNTNRSFKTLAWDRRSFTIAYGHREVHIHPNCQRRLSVFEAMRLQGFPDKYVLSGTLSSQITQVSEAVPPPLATAVARSVAKATV